MIDWNQFINEGAEAETQSHELSTEATEAMHAMNALAMASPVDFFAVLSAFTLKVANGEKDEAAKDLLDDASGLLAEMAQDWQERIARSQATEGW